MLLLKSTSFDSHNYYYYADFFHFDYINRSEERDLQKYLLVSVHCTVEITKRNTMSLIIRACP